MTDQNVNEMPDKGKKKTSGGETPEIDINRLLDLAKLALPRLLGVNLKVSSTVKVESSEQEDPKDGLNFSLEILELMGIQKPSEKPSNKVEGEPSKKEVPEDTKPGPEDSTRNSVMKMVIMFLKNELTQTKMIEDDYTRDTVLLSKLFVVPGFIRGWNYTNNRSPKLQSEVDQVCNLCEELLHDIIRRHRARSSDQ